MTAIRDIIEADCDSILALNDAEQRQTSAMDRDRLQELLALACHRKVALVGQEVAGFLLAMDEAAPYDNANHRWFVPRFRRFLYVDRIVVGSRHAGHGIGSALYRDLFEHARRQGIATITCEYNLEPPNPASRAFHARFGFHELGSQRTPDGSKRVSMQAAAT